MCSLVKSRPLLAFRHGVVFTIAFMLGHQIAVAILPTLALRTAIDDASIMLECMLVTMAFFYAARRTARRSRRLSLAWLAWALALLCYTLGNVAWLIVEVGLKERPFPSIADAFFLAYYPLFVAGLLLLPAARFAPGERTKVMLDMGIVTLSAVLIFWNFLFGPIISAGAPSALALSLAYPAGDLALLWGLCALLLRPSNTKSPGPLPLIAAAALAQVLGDVTFSYQSLAGTYQIGGLANVVWTIGLALGLLAAAWQVALVRSEPGEPGATQKNLFHRKPATWRMALPYIWLGAAFFLLVWRYDHPLPMSFPAMALSVAGVIGLVLIRQIAALNENARLSAQLQQELRERGRAAEALRRLEKAMETMNLGVTITDPDGIIIYANPAEEQMHGYAPGELLDKPGRILAPPDQWRPMRPAERANLPSWQRESVNVRKDGSLFPVQLFSDVVKDDAGELIGIVTSCLDITERKQAEEALRQARDELELRVEERTAQLARANQELQCTAERQTLLYQVLRSVSGQLDPDAVASLAVQAIAGFTGWPHICFVAANEVGTHWVIRATGGELAARVGLKFPMSQGVIGRAFRTAQTQLVPDVRADPDYEGESHVLLSELTVPIKQGDRVLAVLNLEDTQPASFGAEEVQLAESLAEAISLALENARLFKAAQLELDERRRIEVALLGTRARLQHLLASSPTVIYSCEVCGDYAATYVSENVQALLGYQVVDFLNDDKFWINHIHPEDVQHVLAGLDLLFQTGYHTHEYRFQHKEGNYRWMHDEARLVCNEQGQPIEIVGSWIDITERKLAEEQLMESLREKEVLLKEIHHRVKNNMQVVSSLLSLQSDCVQDTASLEVLRESQNRVKSMALIHEKLYQSKDLARVDFADYVRDLTTHLFRTYRTSACDVALQVSVSETVRLGIDTAIPCGLIVNELVSNALKYAFPGGRVGVVRVELGRNGGNALKLVVSDNGIGFPPEVDPRQTDSLGLRLVWTLADQIEGSVELDRSAGTTFRITFTEAPA